MYPCTCILHTCICTNGVDGDVCMYAKIRSLLLGRQKIFFFIFEVTTWKGYKESSANHCLGDADVCVYTYTCM